MKKLFIFEGFSLVEMLMALLVASLLLAALVPVMTRRMNENMHITGDMTLKGEYEIEEIAFGDSKYCPKIINDANGNPLYCEGEYVVKEGVSNITVTAIGAGGGGGTAPTAGFIKYTNAGSTNTFTVPAMVSEIESTLIGGAPGGNPPDDFQDYRIFKNPGAPTPKYDGINNAPSAKVIETKSDGSYTWSPSDFSLFKGQKMIVTACGGGGGGGGVSRNVCSNGICTASGGGGAGYYQSEVSLTMPASWTSVTVEIGGGGGGGGSSSGSSTYHLGYDGGSKAGGGGGASKAGGDSGGGGKGGKQGGNGGTAPQGGWGRGGESGDTSETGLSNGNDYYKACHNSFASCPDLVGDPNGGKVNITAYMPSTTINAYYGGAGGGGSLVSGYGGGGGGGSVYAGGGGGGGGGTRIVGIGWLWPGGGGGGGGCEISTNKTSYSMAAGGGGGGGGTFSNYSSSHMSGGNGGICNFLSGKYIAGGGGRGLRASASGVNPGKVAENENIFGSDFCNGGAGIAAGGVGTTAHGESGKPGAMKLDYVSSTGGGYGGSPAKYIERRHLNINEKQELSLIIGKGTAGGTGGKLIYEDGALKYTPKKGALFGGSTIIKDKSGNIIIETGTNVANIEGGGAPNDFQGGNGGIVKTAFTSCEPAQGGKVLGEKAANGTGYGCGGGGAYLLSEAGDGSGGYARLSWNMYWDTALNSGKGDYKYADMGTGGGGASGNAITETVRVSEKQVIKIRIGAGGIGAKVVNNEIIPATSGGTTIFGDTNFIEIKAGGGGGGISPTVVKNGDTTTLVNGKGGEPSKICDVGSHKYFNNKNRCTQGKEGKTPGEDNTVITNGGLGGAFSLTVNNKTYTGTGGQGGMQSTEVENSKGKTPESTNVASGGGGAALLIYKDGISNMSQLNNPQGGNGANGRIVLKVWK